MAGVSISQSEYRANPAISSTDIKRMAQSMAHFKYFQDNPEDNDTQALQFGRAYHKYCLEPYDFSNEFVVAPNIDRRTKMGKEEYANFLAKADGKEVILQETMDTLEAMRIALYATPFVKKLIYGKQEERFFGTDEDTGVECEF